MIVVRKVVKVECGWTFGHLLTVIDKSLSDAIVTRDVTSRNERFTDPMHEVPIDSPIQLCEQHGYNVCFYSALEITREPVGNKQRKNAFDILMENARERRRP